MSDKDKYMISLICEDLKRCNWTYLQNKNRVTDVENKFMVTSGERVVEGLGDWGWHMHTAIYKIDN